MFQTLMMSRIWLFSIVLFAMIHSLKAFPPHWMGNSNIVGINHNTNNQLTQHQRGQEEYHRLEISTGNMKNVLSHNFFFPSHFFSQDNGQRSKLKVSASGTPSESFSWTNAVDIPEGDESRHHRSQG